MPASCQSGFQMCLAPSAPQVVAPSQIFKRLQIHHIEVSPESGFYLDAELGAELSHKSDYAEWFLEPEAFPHIANTSNFRLLRAISAISWVIYSSPTNS